ncbi:hypothetical protein H5410_061347 [Solanum commersonii]|uniref:Uncharacterized protein n=1 Tax=Solanum commersonii TaxID=4109 RepID=A0A9J5W7I8_SOLCO|nr:hypothetical protein H5410_061347 [Solanum commersonii]
MIDTVVEVAKVYDAAVFMFHKMKTKTNCLFAAPPVNWPPRKNSSIESVNAVQALESLFPLDLSFKCSYSSSYVGVFTNGVGVLPLNQWCRKEMAVFIQGGGGGGSTIPITCASSLIDLWVVLSVSTMRWTLIIHQHRRTSENYLH